MVPLAKVGWYSFEHQATPGYMKPGETHRRARRIAETQAKAAVGR